MRDLRDEVRRRLAGAAIDPARKIEVVEEIGQDLEDRYQELRARGVTEAEAEARVMAELDGHDVLARELAGALRPPRVDVVPGEPRRGLLGDLAGDLRYGARALWKSPAFTLVTILSLALGIGANTAIFQLIDAIHLRALPVSEPQRLARVQIKDRHWASGGFYSWHADLTNPQWERVRDRQEGFQSILAWGDGGFNLSPSGEVRPARGLFVSGDFFRTLGVAPALGRFFTAADDHRGCGAPGAVVSHAFWQRELGADPGAIGRKLSLDGHPVELLGVAPASFTGLEVGRSFDVAVPLCMDELFRGERHRLDGRSDYWLSVIGRLKPGWTLERASAQLTAISAGIIDETVPEKYPPESVAKYKEYRFGAVSAATGISRARKDWSTPLLFLLATAGLVLLIACANLANLLLARASAREREIAVRMALGASRGRLLRQLMTESLLLAVLGAAAGLALATFLSELMVSYLSTRDRAIFFDLTPDWRVLGFTMGLAALTCLLFGLAPALRASRTDVGVVLKASGGHGATVARFGLRRLLVAVQVALSFVLLCGALLFARSLAKLSSVDAGFQGEGVLLFGADLRRLELPVEQRVAMQTQLLERVRAVPGVAAASTSSIIPISGSGWNQDVIEDGKPVTGENGGLDTYFNRVSDGYFATLGTPLLAGRDFGPGDTLEAPTVAIVNETLARKVFGAQSPVGRRLRVDASSNGPGWTVDVIGMVKDSKYYDLREENKPLVYVSAKQDKEPYPAIDIMVRPSGGHLADTVAGVRDALVAASPLITVDIDALERMIHDSLLEDRLMAVLSGFFGLLAGILATVGLYGVIAYGVARRTHEIGIRLALGADRGRISRMIVRETAGLVLLGLGAGALLALAATRTAASMLYGLAPHDPLTFGLTAALLATVSLVAAALPARRAARVDPMVALREE